MDVTTARRTVRDHRERIPAGSASLPLATALDAIETLCDQPMNPGTPWWVFRDAVRAILEKGS